MSNRSELTDEEWQTFYSLLLLNPRVYVDSVERYRCFFNAVLWILRSGGQCRLLRLPHWVNGIPCLSGFKDGANRAYGEIYMRAVDNILICNGS